VKGREKGKRGERKRRVGKVRALRKGMTETAARKRGSEGEEDRQNWEKKKALGKVPGGAVGKIKGTAKEKREQKRREEQKKNSRKCNQTKIKRDIVGEGQTNLGGP